MVENEPLCQRLSLTELMPIAWQRLTKYKLLINNIHKSYKKDWDALSGTAVVSRLILYSLSSNFLCAFVEEDRKEATMIETAHTCVKVCKL